MVNILDVVEEYEALRVQESAIKKRKESLAKQIKEYAKDNGNTDAKGSSYSQQGGYTFGQVAKTSIKLNQDKALAFLTEHKPDILSEVIETVQYVSENKLEAMFKDGKLSIEELEELMDKKVSYQVSVNKDKEEEPQDDIVEVVSKPRVKKILKKK